MCTYYNIMLYDRQYIYIYIRYRRYYINISYNTYMKNKYIYIYISDIEYDIY